MLFINYRLDFRQLIIINNNFNTTKNILPILISRILDPFFMELKSLYSLIGIICCLENSSFYLINYTNLTAINFLL